jgi:hypothetical protein
MGFEGGDQALPRAKPSDIHARNLQVSLVSNTLGRNATGKPGHHISDKGCAELLKFHRRFTPSLLPLSNAAPTRLSHWTNSLKSGYSEFFSNVGI